MVTIAVAPPATHSLRLYVMPTTDFVPRVHQLNEQAQKVLNRMLRARRIHHRAKLVMSGVDTRIALRHFPGHEPLPVHEAQRSVECFVGEPAAPIVVRATWVNPHPLGSRSDDPVFRNAASKATAVGRAWCVQLDEDPAVHPAAAFTVGAIASALAHLTQGFVMSWDHGVPYDRTPCFPDNLQEWWFNPDYEPRGQWRWRRAIDDLRAGRGLGAPSPTLRRDSHRDRQHRIAELMEVGLAETVLKHIGEIVDSPARAPDAIREIREWLSAHDEILRASAIEPQTETEREGVGEDDA